MALVQSSSRVRQSRGGRVRVVTQRPWLYLNLLHIHPMKMSTHYVLSRVSAARKLLELCALLEARPQVRAKVETYDATGVFEGEYDAARIAELRRIASATERGRFFAVRYQDLGAASRPWCRMDISFGA